MKRDLEKRLRALEERVALDHVSTLSFDRYYLGDFGEDESQWSVLYDDGTADYIVLQHRSSSEIAGCWIDRRSEAEIVASGAGEPLAYR